MMTDLEQRLTTLEPLRRRTGLLVRILQIARLWVVRMGTAFAASVAVPSLIIWLGAEGDTPEPWLVAAVAITALGSIAVGLALVVPRTWRLVIARGEDDLAYRRRFEQDVLAPLVRAAVPGATLAFADPAGLALFDRSGVYTRPVTGLRQRSPFRVTGAVDGTTWEATPLRVWEAVSASSSTTNSKTSTVVVHDGLFAWAPAPNGLSQRVLVVDRESGTRAHQKAHPLATLVGRTPDPPAVGDSTFDQRFLVLAADRSEAVQSLTFDLRRAMHAVLDLVGTPVRIAVGPDGVGLAFASRGRFQALDASVEVEERLGFRSRDRAVSEMAATLRADAVLLGRIPEALRLLVRSLPPA